MAQKKLITILGITGVQGGSVAEHFLKLPGWKIRGVSRDASKPSAQAWADRGVEVVSGDLNDPASLRAAFRGAAAVYGTTDFWQALNAPGTFERAAKEGKPVNELCYEQEYEQRVGMAAALAEVLDEEGGDVLEVYVLSTLAGCKRWTDGKIKQCLHFDVKFDSDEVVRKKYPKLWEKTSRLFVGMYMSNWNSFPGMGPAKQSDGTLKLQVPIAPDAPVPFVDAKGDTGRLTEALINGGPGRAMLGTGGLRSHAEWAEAFSKASGKETTFETANRAEWEAKADEVMPKGIGFEIADMFQMVEEVGYDGSDPEIEKPEAFGITSGLTSLEDFLKTQDFSKV